MSNSSWLMDCIHQAPLSVGFLRQESWSGLPFPSPGDLRDPGIQHASALARDSLPLSYLGSPGAKTTLFSSVQFSSVAQSCLTLCDPMNCSTPGLPIHHQTHVHWVGDAIQPSHPLLFPSPPDPNPCQHQGLFQWVSSSHEVAKVLEFQLQHQSFQWTLRTDLL